MNVDRLNYIIDNICSSLLTISFTMKKGSNSNSYVCHESASSLVSIIDDIVICCKSTSKS